ncbi:hypothetical protein EG359_01025 [Chryseobacterium joostei]|uniref:Uncharacterized protein n=2 Tax=Chryseobacterium joostei TaxID=112234 RepID=A0A1N7IS80_9FLAO|nr:hypothetical protein EG359_01025 [Chryseobacterium joostei]SIS39880.1 hypothetical protein SAMN05421768_106324 [Chryseobacterium joostei]
MPWGDYGNTLFTGFAYPDENNDEIIYIERAGPFVPAIYKKWDMILVSESTRQKLEKSDLKGIQFINTTFKKIVDIDWQNWDLEAEKPRIYPAGGEPENYIFTRKHNAEIAKKMEAIWCLKLDKETLIGRKQRNVSGRNELFIIENAWTGNDIFISKSAGHIYLTEKAKKWFEENLPECIMFREFNSKIATQQEIDFVLDYIKPTAPKVDPFAHLTEKDWKNYQKFLEHATKFIAKSKTDKTEKSKAKSIEKAIESFKNAQAIKPLGKKEQFLFEQLTK